MLGVPVPVLIATMLTALLLPLVDWLDRHRVPRGAAVALIVLVTVGMVEHFFALRSRFAAPQPGGQ